MMNNLIARALLKVFLRLKEPSTFLPLLGLLAVLFGVPPETIKQVAGLVGYVGLDPESLKSGIPLGVALGVLIGRKELKTFVAESQAK